MPHELSLILTHEHTDFDALASLLGAALLYPEYQAVLPRRMNRNVAEFVALYRAYLPFVAPDELPKRKIGRIVLVDTRALNAPRGLAPGCQITVIDHHLQPESESPKQGVGDPIYTIHSEAVGANATLLIERMVNVRTPLTSLQATLLALGIHEDTNSLTYGGSTARDAAALAWLLEAERGVNQDLLVRFLNHPLSDEQRALLQELIESSEHVDARGLNIVIATAEAASKTEEISTVAARLRDYHEPDALFVLVRMEGMVQVVARSTTNDIDVGAVMRRLGGGGHLRAAAAAVHDLSLQEIRSIILKETEQQARVVRTVAEIMSSGRPQTLHPDMRISEAAALMRRYGYEGFPVIAAHSPPVDTPPTDPPAHERTEILGVLTRREADRAMDHGLGNERVRRFMRSGATSVTPSDSLNLLRKRMAESGWGQIPVVDKEGALIGIVTRTDLINTWDEKAATPDRGEEGARRLRERLTPVQHGLLQRIGVIAHEMDFALYVVGGFVRDLYLAPESGSSRESLGAFDIDLVVEGNGIALANRVSIRYGGRVVPHKQFGTAKWLLNDPDAPVDLAALSADLEIPLQADNLPAHLDFVTARTEFYTSPSALPTVESSSIKLDLVRRDFTINTLALALTPARWGELLDSFGGLKDIREGVVRVLHSLSFVDDPTRILRAVRYEQRFGFQIGRRTTELLRDALLLLEKVTPARVRHELERILQEAAPEVMLLRLNELGVLQAIHPDLCADAWVMDAFAHLRTTLAPPADALVTDAPLTDALNTEPLERLYWAAFVYPLSTDIDEDLTERLRLRKETQRLVREMRRVQKSVGELRRPDLAPSQVVALLEESEPAAIALVALLESDETLSSYAMRYLSEWQHVLPLLNGNDLKRLGIPTGAHYRTLLWQLRAGRLDGSLHSQAEEETFVREQYGSIAPPLQGEA